MTNGNDTANPYFNDSSNGLTKREYFAAKAMQGLISNPEYFGRLDNDEKAKHAVFFADELIKALNK